MEVYDYLKRNYCKRADHAEVLPAQNMKESVALVEAVEESGLVYAYGENYCYIPAPLTFLRAGGKAPCPPASPQSNPPTNPNLNHLNFHQHVHLSHITP